MHKSLFILVLFVLYLTGCTTQAIAPVETTTVNTVPVGLPEVAPEPKAITDIPDKTAIPESVLQNIPTKTKISSPTGSSGMLTTPIVQIVGSSYPIPICAGKGLPETPETGFGIPGTLIYHIRNDGGPRSGLHYVGGTPLKQGIFSIGENPSIYALGLSPDGKWLAYSPIVKTQNNQTSFDNPSIILLGANGKRIEHSLDLTWLRNINEPGYQLDSFMWSYWINDHLIFTLVNSKIPGDNIGVGRYYLAILDPFQGTWQTQEFNQLPNQTGLFGAAFSQDLRHVLYDKGGITLTEINDKTVVQLWHDEHSEFSSLSAARWSPDGAWAVFANHGILSPDPAHLTLISKDGKQVYEIHNPEIGSFFKNFFWSPNGRYFAFVSKKYHENAPDKDDLLIFDINRGTFVLQCPILTVDLPLAELTWSPGSDLIAISQEGGTLRVLDIATGAIVNLNIDGVAVGWSDKFFN